MTLTIQTIKDRYKTSRYYNKGSNLLWLLLGIVLLIYICVIMSRNIWAIITVPIFIFPICGIYIWYYIVTNSVGKALDTNDFYIYEDVCINKKIRFIFNTKMISSQIPLISFFAFPLEYPSVLC